MNEKPLISWREGVRKSEDFWNSCPTCGSLDTHIIRESHPSSGYENTRRCEMCRYEWDTKVYDNDYLDAVYGGEVYDPMYHPEQYPEVFGLDEDDDELAGNTCPHCNGTGILFGDDCLNCDGMGYEWWQS